MSHSKDLPSIYTALPILPPISSQYDPQTASLDERATTVQLARILEQGPANYVLRHALITHAEREEHRRRHRERFDKESSGPDSPPRRKRSRRTGWSSTAEGGDDEKTESEHRHRARKGARRSAKSLESDLPRLATELPPIDVPTHFPSGASLLAVSAADLVLSSSAFETDVCHAFLATAQSLLSSLHLHASHLYASTHSLLPPLTTEAPLLPPHLLTHFNHVSTALNAEEQLLLEQPGLSVKQLNRVRDNRLGKMGTGTRKRVWTNCEKKFEPSSLVALGMLTKLLVEDSLKPPTIEISHHRSPPPPPEPLTMTGIERSSGSGHANGANALAVEGADDGPRFELPTPPSTTTASS
ncbi:hypothetical protein JCM11491_000843 [Sporobolomyces phaffii]